MDEPLRRFQWPVAPRYHWQHWLGADGRPVVIPTDGLKGLESESAVEHTWRALAEQKPEMKTGPILGPVQDSGEVRYYSPMSREHPSLFKTFAELDYRDRDALLRFASTYGRLGLELQEQHVPTRSRKLPREYHYAIGESHLNWAREICLMRKAIYLTRSKTAREEQLEKENWTRFGLEPPYKDWRDETTWLFNYHLQHVQGRIILEPDAAPRLSFAPLTLLAAMWLQLAQAIVGNKEFRSCKQCQHMFEISTDPITGFRSHREFCSATCKTNDYRRRKALALKRLSLRESVAKVSLLTKTNVQTVRTWAKALQKRGRTIRKRR